MHRLNSSSSEYSADQATNQTNPRNAKRRTKANTKWRDTRSRTRTFSISICLTPPTYIPLIKLPNIICMHCKVPVQSPVVIQQPTDAMPRGTPRQMPVEVHCILNATNMNTLHAMAVSGFAACVCLGCVNTFIDSCIHYTSENIWFESRTLCLDS